MRTQSRDTAPEIERIQIERVRDLSFARKFAAICTGAETLAYANLHSDDATEPHSERAQAARFLARQYDASLAAEFVAAVEQVPAWARGPFDIGLALSRVIEALSSLDSSYALIGQPACALYGFPRPVFHVEIVADLPSARIAELAARLRLTELVLDATGRKRSDGPSIWPSRSSLRRWRVLDLLTLVCIEVLPLGQGRRAQRIMRRARLLPSGDDRLGSIRVAAPEDVLLLDLVDLVAASAHRPLSVAESGHSPAPPGKRTHRGRCTKAADARSTCGEGRWVAPEERVWDDDRWNDVLGVLKVQAPTLDMAALTHARISRPVHVAVRYALQEAGLRDFP